MAAQRIIILAAVMVEAISCQCLGPYGPGFGPGLPAPGLPLAAEAYGPLAPGLPGPGPLAPTACGLGLPGIPSSNGGGFLVTSSSPISPSGVSVQTDSMAIEGPLAVSGQLPFLGVVALEGPLPIAGLGAVSYGCGAGGVGIVNELGAGAGAYPNAFGPEIGPIGPGYGYNGYGCGCGPFY